jgi:hypothetical protein
VVAEGGDSGEEFSSAWRKIFLGISIPKLAENSVFVHPAVCYSRSFCKTEIQAFGECVADVQPPRPGSTSRFPPG